MTPEVSEQLAELHQALASTQERPVERTASRWIGEAEAIAADLATADLDEEVIVERLTHIGDLLDHVETTGDQQADEQVSSAKRLTADLLERLA